VSSAGSKKKICQLASGREAGQAVARVESLMHAGEALPRVTPQTKMPDVIYEDVAEEAGSTAVVEARGWWEL